jgi:D-glycero-D-manno-heptose 1,7-bisphosphate phosphatase
VRRAVFFDRDGVIDRLVPDPLSGLPESPLTAADVALIPGAAAALLRLHDAGWLIIGASNQPAAAKGVVSLRDLEDVQARVLELLEREDVAPDAFVFCYHHPEGTVESLTRECDCRKPAPGMVTSIAKELDIDPTRSWLVGDTDTDVLAGAAAGCRTVLVENPDSAHKRCGAVEPDLRVADFSAATEAILTDSADLGSRSESR